MATYNDWQQAKFDNSHAQCATCGDVYHENQLDTNGTCEACAHEAIDLEEDMQAAGTDIRAKMEWLAIVVLITLGSIILAYIASGSIWFKQ